MTREKKKSNEDAVGHSMIRRRVDKTQTELPLLDRISFQRDASAFYFDRLLNRMAVIHVSKTKFALSVNALVLFPTTTPTDD